MVDTSHPPDGLPYGGLVAQVANQDIQSTQISHYPCLLRMMHESPHGLSYSHKLSQDRPTGFTSCTRNQNHRISISR